MTYQTSKGEQKICDILNAKKIKYEREYTFQDLKGLKGAPLRFDFAIFNSRGQVQCLIDYDGSQHFRYTPHFHKNLMGFKKGQEYDRRKNRYCLMHNIPFIRIPYWDYDILTYNRIINTPEYRVKSMYHNDDLIRQGVKKNGFL